MGLIIAWIIIIMKGTILLSAYKEEDTEEVYFDLNEFFMFEEDEEKIKFIKDMAMEKNHNIEKVNFNKDDLAELESEIEDMNDTSDMHPNETFDEL